MKRVLEKGPHGLLHIDALRETAQSLHPGGVLRSGYVYKNTLGVFWVDPAGRGDVPSRIVMDAFIAADASPEQTAAACAWLEDFAAVCLADVLPAQGG